MKEGTMKDTNVLFQPVRIRTCYRAESFCEVSHG